MKHERLRHMLHLRCIQLALLQGKSDADVREQLDEDGLVVPTAPQLAAVRKALRPPPSFRPDAANDVASRSFLQELGLQDFFPATRLAKEARDVLETARAREICEASAIIGLPVDSVAATLGSTLGYSASVGGLELFYKIFFDAGAVPKSALCDVLEKHIENLAPDLEGILGRPPLVALPKYKCVRTLALEATRGNGTIASVLIALGCSPRTDPGSLLRQLEQLTSMARARGVHRGPAALRSERLIRDALGAKRPESH